MRQKPEIQTIGEPETWRKNQTEEKAKVVTADRKTYLNAAEVI